MRIIYNEYLSQNEIIELENEFQEWIKEEYLKRMIKKGKLFSFDITNEEDMKAITFGKIQFMYIGDSSKSIIECLKYFDIYNKMLQNMIQSLNNFIKENKLKLSIQQSEGLTKYYIISK